jgi:long-chain acyl-CoA synthetase
MARQIRVKVEDASWWKRFLFQMALKEGYRKLEAREEGRSLSIWHKITWWLADKIVLSVARGHYGMKRVQMCTVGGTACAPELIRFFRALGAPLCNNYGISEIGMITATLPKDTRYDTVGRALPGMELKIEGDEILVRCPAMATGYWKNPEGFMKKMKGEWYCTGDAGRIDEDGHLVFYDRVEEMIRLQGKSSYSPQFIETRLRFSPYIKDAVIFGSEDKPSSNFPRCRKF